jgi:serine/threonine protein phosphatase PrpC
MSYKFSKAAPATDIGNSHINQDAAFTADNSLGVFDGHSFRGEVMANMAKTVFETETSDFESLFASAEDACRSKLRSILISNGTPFQEHNGVLYKGGVYDNLAPFQGGTTATIVRLDPETGSLSCANVGDSDALYFDDDISSGEVITSDHTPTCLEEWNRIHAISPGTKFVFSQGSNITPRPIWTQYSLGKWELNEMGGYQYADVRNNWASYVNVPGVGTLAMTRVLANFGFKKYGIIAKPDTLTVDAPAAGVTRAVVLGSDGLWDALHYNEVRDIVRSPELLGKPEEATTVLLKLGIEKSKERFGLPACHDNITAIVAYYTGI